jgi:hypothetical protein
MKRMSRFTLGIVPVLALLFALPGCSPARNGSGAAPRSASSKPAPVASGSRAVVEQYLQAAAKADGPGMYALIASSERKDESPKSLADTARDRYSPQTSWEVLKTDEKSSTSQVVVDIKHAKVQPNPCKFTLSREAGEWRIVQSPELHEDDQRDEIKIKF